MIYAWINGEKRQPGAKGERAICSDCGNELFAVMPVETVAHWRHKAGECDSWSEPEGQWHLQWKECFDLQFREVPLKDPLTQELHRADILYWHTNQKTGTVLELQHSPIPEEERNARERFYTLEHKMFWLIHLHNEHSLAGRNFGLSLNFQQVVEHKGRQFNIMSWIGHSHQFIEKWKRSKAHVFFDWQDQIFYLANSRACASLVASLKKGEFALCRLSKEEFIAAVKGA